MVSRLLFVFLLISSSLFATDVLERNIAVRFQQTPLKEALAEIARQGGFEWSYNAGIIDENRRVTLVAEGLTVREILVQVLGEGYSFKQNGNYLILRKQRKPQKRLSGYISDQRSGRKMAGVTVYDRRTLRATTTNENGYYELPVTPRSEIVIAKLSYRDTVVQVSSQTSRLVKLDLVTDTLPHPSTASLRKELNRFSVKMEQFFVGSSQKLLTLNVRDSLHRHFQASVVPGLGNHYRLSGNVTNDFSLNLLAGYSRGNRVLELGAGGNINRENTSGAQIAGVFNVVGGNIAGVQAAGGFNVLGGNASGLQAAGIFNFTNGGIRGVQAAGSFNFAGDSLRGAQIAGSVNIARLGRPGSVQAAGSFNLLMQGELALQLAGAFNRAHRINGLQAAGVVNSADTVHGAQVAWIFNRAKKVKGVQLGLINVAREIDGTQLGVINLSKRGGYVVAEASANDVLYANVAFKSGVPAIYTILTAGLDPQKSTDSRLWAYGAGVGARAKFTPWLGLNVDLIGRHLSAGHHDNNWQEWAQLAVGLDIQFGRHFSIAGGPSANLFLIDPARTAAAALRDRVVGRDWLDASTNADGWLSAWTGWTVGVRGRF